MRNVVRTDRPAILTSKSKEWTSELLNSMKGVDAKKQRLKTGKKRHKIPASIWNRYRHNEVKQELQKMYGELCCYCEQRIGHVAFGNIEHRQPKSVFPELTFDWNNLHLACPVCNTAKKDKWNSTHPILDAAVDLDINSKHLSYKVTRLSVERSALSDCGATTINHTSLNRPVLADLEHNGTRNQVLCSVFHTVTDLRKIEKKSPTSPRLITAKAELRKQFKGEHGSLVEFYAKKILDEI